MTTKPKSKGALPRRAIPRKIRQAAATKLTGVGVVAFCILGTSDESKAVQYTSAKLVKVLQEGLPFQELEDLRTQLAMPSEKLAPMLGISRATFHRRKGDASRLPLAVSDRVVRYARLLGHAFNVFEDRDAAKQWLQSAQFGLGGAVPLEYAKTEIGAREVEDLLGRIEHGVYS